MTLYCVDCKWSVASSGGKFVVCSHPKAARRARGGKERVDPKSRADDVDRLFSCATHRDCASWIETRLTGFCGARGRWWELRS